MSPVVRNVILHDCVECDWCGNWQHGDSAHLSSDELAALADLWERHYLMLCFSVYCANQKLATLAMKFFTDIHIKQDEIEKRVNRNRSQF